MGNSWSTTAANKREQRDRDFAAHLQTIEEQFKAQKLTDRISDDITRLNVFQLVQKLNTFEITSYQLILIYSRRTGGIGRELNAVTEDNFIKALEMAKQCDRIRKQTKKTNWKFGDQWNMEKFLPPLFGVPMSIKDTFNMKGFATTLGAVARINEIQQNQGSIIAVTRHSGIIPFVRTNLPQLGMSAQCFNNLWGRTTNPWNRDRTPGGSSGGQAAMVASRCSPIGLGSDIGGSLRIPSDFCGLFTIKSHSQRVSSDGHSTFSLSFNGNNNIPLAVGPIAKSTLDCALWMKNYCCKQLYNGDHDPYNNMKEFDDQLFQKSCENKKMKIGYFRRLKILEPSLATQRAMQQTIAILQSLGHQLVQIQIPNQDAILRAATAQFVAQGQELRSYREILKGEPLISDYSLIELTQKSYLKPISWLFYRLAKIMYPRFATVMQNGSPIPSVHDYLMHGGNIKTYKKEWVNYLKQSGIDVVISPGFGCNAYLHGAFSEGLSAALYTQIWNCLDVPAGSVPITVVRRDEQQYMSQYSDMLTNTLRKNAQNSESLPAGIQVSGFPFKEEVVLGVMYQIEKENKFYEKHRLP